MPNTNCEYCNCCHYCDMPYFEPGGLRSILGIDVRDNDEEITMEQLEKELGRKVKIIK